ncbi:PREDICTED: uncharacterized protein LOC109590197 [Amphimedon queenslandica]|uniref:Ig-like domain-containing protein n=2 Tax=Amphimedon queenslandica TaxID=400682 RepID=A0AAN0JXK1_AMPQE|nr:PREDICTED: uncharacterized protein LOC109590197 [Amphimedon queenslandica]|eukprot:XP_019861675.1 PREDICTED: uncharacterized protein LOC109590197 [Amphimedon queenslandica]
MAVICDLLNKAWTSVTSRHNMMLLLFLVFMDMTQSQAAVALLPNGAVSICQRELKITCNVTGSILVWTYGRSITSFSSVDTQPQYIAPFSFILQSHGNGTLVSVASVNVSASLNGSTLECRDTLIITGSSIRQQITFNVKNSVRISYLHVDAVSSDTLLIIWAGADCIQSYDVFINGTNVNTTNGMSLLYNTGGAIGSIDVLVNSVDYYGRAVGNLSTQYQFNSE